LETQYMKKRFVVAAAAVIVTGAAFVGAVQAQDVRGMAPRAPNAGLLDAFDTNKDGAVTQDEINGARGANLAKHDRNTDGKLSIEEYTQLWLEAMRTDMVRQFQGHDTDGDGQVTADEFNARFKDAVARADVNRDGKVDAADMQRPVVQQQAPQRGNDGPQIRRPDQGPQQGPQRGAPQQPQRRGAALDVPAAAEAAPARAI
jgi:hypothetical protein